MEDWDWTQVFPPQSVAYHLCPHPSEVVGVTHLNYFSEKEGPGAKVLNKFLFVVFSYTLKSLKVGSHTQRINGVVR